MKRVVVTGMGVVSPLGIGLDNFWNAIKNKECGIDRVTLFDVSEYTCQIAGEVKNFEPTDYVDKKEAKRMDRYAQFAVASAKMAIENSGIDLSKTDLTRVGVITGSGIGGMETLEKQADVLKKRGPSKVSPFFVPMMISNIAAAHIAIMTGAKGYNLNVVSACASGTNAIGDAMHKIRYGMCDVIIAGGAEAAITPLSFAGFCSMKAMSTKNDNPKEASCPFDLDRDGFVMGEGSGMLVLEELEHAKSRGANIVCEVVGYGATDDAYHITAPVEGGEGGARAMANALADATLMPADVDYINAHGTSTPYNDKFETQAIKTVFGDDTKVNISSTKAMTGHLLGAAGAIEAIICALSVRENYIPPTINYKTADPECDLDYVVNEGREKEVNVAISNSLGFGGHNATIAVKKYVD